jgi:YidC/Oxa1 family membrane protein insertase
MQQKRLLIALVLSSAILFLWSYFYPVTTPQNQKPGATPSPAAASPAATQTATSNSSTAQAAPTVTPNVSTAPQRIITVKTPLYEAKFDTLGAEPVSWILKFNRNNNSPIYSVAGHKADKKPLELISPEGLKRQPRQVPLQIQTGDSAVDYALSSSTYKVEGVDQATGDVELNLGPGEKKELTFVLEDPNGLQVRKKIVFDAALYGTDLSLLVKRLFSTLRFMEPIFRCW